MPAIASNMIRGNVVVVITLAFMLSLLSWIHFSSWGAIAKQWERTRLMFASFQQITERESLGAKVGVSIFKDGDELALPYEKLIQLKRLKYVVSGSARATFSMFLNVVVIVS